VYEYDRRGRGDSGEIGPYSIDREVDDMAALMHEVGSAPFVFGHSSGAALALETVATGLPVGGLVVYEPPYTEGPTDAVAAQLAEMAAAGRRSDVVEAFVRLQGIPDEVVDQMKAGPNWSHMESFAHTLPYEVRLCNNGSVPVDRLVKISTPTLALAGGTSPAWAQEGAHAIAAAVPNARSRVLEGQGHGVADDVIIPVLTEFFV
jgi:pimeloyl-ACP methyl ester carboxylesterase